ncbi:hypothetical protein FRC06_008173, partial [Ceratobasidium sp. 370]
MWNVDPNPDLYPNGSMDLSLENERHDAIRIEETMNVRELSNEEEANLAAAANNAGPPGIAEDERPQLYDPLEEGGEPQYTRKECSDGVVYEYASAGKIIHGAGHRKTRWEMQREINDKENEGSIHGIWKTAREQEDAEWMSRGKASQAYMTELLKTEQFTKDPPDFKTPKNLNKIIETKLSQFGGPKFELLNLRLPEAELDLHTLVWRDPEKTLDHLMGTARFAGKMSFAPKILIGKHGVRRPDLLHGVHKLFLDHYNEWSINALGAEEYDTRLKAQIPTPGERMFERGATKLKQLSGKDWRALFRVHLAIVAGADSATLTKATQAMSDCIAFAQMAVHTEKTLEAFERSLAILDSLKEIWIRNGSKVGKKGKVKKDWAIPKKHIIGHIPAHIWQKGTMDNYTTETMKHLHSPVLKASYKASNRKEWLLQIVRRLNRHESMREYREFLIWLKELRKAEEMEVDSPEEDEKDDADDHSEDGDEDNGDEDNGDFDFDGDDDDDDDYEDEDDDNEDDEDEDEYEYEYEDDEGEDEGEDEHELRRGAEGEGEDSQDRCENGLNNEANNQGRADEDGRDGGQGKGQPARGQ